MITVSELTDTAEVTPDVVAAFGRLLPQLSSSASMLDADQLTELVRFEASHLLLARDDAGTIVGSMTLVVFPIPTGWQSAPAFLCDVRKSSGVSDRMEDRRSAPPDEMHLNGLGP